jgi:hypothetical protein
MRHNLILLIISLIFLVSCSNNKPKLYEIERQFKTDGEGHAIFHPSSEQDGGLGIRFPGYLIGIERTDRNIIGKPDDFEKLKDCNKDKNYKVIKKILDRQQRTFVSHIVEYWLENDGKYIKEDVFYNIYDKRFGTETQNAYRRGIEELYKLKKKIESAIDEEKEKGTSYTHLFFYSMGWNTDQQESLRNYNSLLYQMRKTYYSPYFVQDEFDPRLQITSGTPTAESLHKKIDKDYRNAVKSEKGSIIENTIDRLNDLLRTPDFFDQLKQPHFQVLQQKKDDVKFKEAMEKIDTLVEKTQEYRNKPFSQLSDKEQDTIIQLNRYLLEILYPEAPNKKVYLKNKPFRPLFVGLSWPSGQRFGSVWWLIGDLRKSMSYIPKAKDADEIGVVWANRVLWDILVPLKKIKKIPLILIGHSLGARIVTRAVFSQGIFDVSVGRGQPEISWDNDYDIDLVIGLQGAFSINRFIQREGKEGSPYSDFKERHSVKKFIFTWSKNDWANPVAYWFTGEEHMGGIYGYAKSYTPQGKDIFDHFEIKVEKELLSSYDVELKNIQIEKEFKKNAVWCRWLWEITQGVLPKALRRNEWNQSFSLSEKISIVDASELIRNKPYGKGGIAHSDIYTPGIAMFVWDCIDNLEN